MSIRPCIAAVVALSGVACGGGGGASVINGNLKGQPFAVKDVISAPVQLTLLGGSGRTCASTANCPSGETCSGGQCVRAITVGAVLMSDDSGLCDKLGRNPPQEPRNTRYLTLALVDFNAATGQFGAPTGAGTYTINTTAMAGKSAIAVYFSTDSNCNNPTGATDPSGRSGTVTLMSANNGSYSGMFDITMDNNEHITGSFGANACSALASLLSTTRPTTCVDR